MHPDPSPLTECVLSAGRGPRTALELSRRLRPLQHACVRGRSSARTERKQAAARCCRSALQQCRCMSGVEVDFSESERATPTATTLLSAFAVASGRQTISLGDQAMGLLSCTRARARVSKTLEMARPMRRPSQALSEPSNRPKRRATIA